MSSSRLQVSIAMLGGRTVELMADCDESIGEFKVKLHRLLGVAPCKQVLLHDASILEHHHQFGCCVGSAPLLITLVVRKDCPPEVQENTKELLGVIERMAPRFVVRPVWASTTLFCAYPRFFPSRARPGFNLYEHPSWQGLDASMDKAIRSYEVDLEGPQLLTRAFRMGCGELALLLMRYGADPRAVPLCDALRYFRSKRSSTVITRSTRYPRCKGASNFPGCSRAPSHPLLLPPEVIEKPAETFALVRAICELQQRQAHQPMSNSMSPVESLAAARVVLARKATERVLLQNCGGSSIATSEFKEATAREAGMDQRYLDQFEKEDLWAGWPRAFLTFGMPMERPSGRFDPDFVRVRACLVASSMCHTPGATPRWYDWSAVPWTETEESVQQSNLPDEHELRKSRNRKWKDSSITKRRVKRVPVWGGTMGCAVWGDTVSGSSKLARRLPKFGNTSARMRISARRREGTSHANEWEKDLDFALR